MTYPYSIRRLITTQREPSSEDVITSFFKRGMIDCPNCGPAMEVSLGCGVDEPMAWTCGKCGYKQILKSFDLLPLKDGA